MTSLTDTETAKDFPTGVATAQRVGAGVSMILFSLMLFVGFVTHPNILSVEMVTDINAWTVEWRGNFLFHFGHLLVMLSVPFIIYTSVRFMGLLKGRGAWYGLIGGILGIFGAFMLAVDKGALTLTLTAFQEVPETQFDGITPALQTMFDRAGWLWITWGYITLPIGFVIQTVGLLREGLITRWQGIPIIIGLILLINPDIEIVSSAGAFLMCIGFLPMGLREIAFGLDRVRE